MEPDLLLWPIVSRREGTFTRMSESAAERAKKTFMDQIGRFANTDVDPDSIHIRGMRIVNSARDFYFSRFTLDALDEIAELLPGRPVMLGHDYRSQPVGTFFAAQRIAIPKPKQPKRDSHWVEALAYYPKDDEGDAIVRRIDIGTWREISLGWASISDECTICHNDMRSFDCPHIPGEVYDRGFCDYEMSGVVSVLEGSHVFAGGQKGTETFVPGERGGDAVRGAVAYPSRSALLGEYLTSEQLYVVKCERALGASKDDIDDLLGHVRDKNVQGLRRSTFAVECSRERFDTSREAAGWVREHSFRGDRIDEAGDGFTFRQSKAKDAPHGLLRVKLDDGVSALVVPGSAQGSDSGRSLDSLFA